MPLDAEFVVDGMALAGVDGPPDAVELVLRDHVQRGHRTEAGVAARGDAGPRDAEG
ncbi:DUF2191 domain-containing protein [Streptomyces sp. NPDC002309]